MKKDKVIDPVLAMAQKAIDPVFSMVQRVIADTSGLDIEEIHEDDELEELNIDMMYEFPVIVRRIEAEISNLDEDLVYRLPMRELRECVTVDDLVELINEVTEE